MSRHSRIIMIIIVIILLIPIAGCWDSNEPERMIYVHGVGIDFIDGKYSAYVQIVNPSLIAKAESIGGSAETKVVVGKGTGRSLNEALFNVYRSTQRRIFWGHLSFFVFTERAIKNGGIKTNTDTFDRYRESRYGTWMFVTKDPLYDILTALPPLDLSTALSRLSDPDPTYRQSSSIKPIDMRELIISLNEPPHEAALPFIKLSENRWRSDEKNSPTIEVIGISFITSDTLKATMKNSTIKGMKWINEDIKREEATVTDQISNISLVIESVKLKKTPIITGNDVSFKISVEAEAILSELVEKEAIKRIEKVAKKEFAKEIKKTYLETLKKDIDAYRFSELLYRKNNKTWKAIQKNGKIPLTPDSLANIDVKVKLVSGERQRKHPTLD